MKRLLASIALMGVITGVQATGIRSYLVHLDVAADGQSRARLQLQLDAVQPGVVLIPLATGAKPAGAVEVESAPGGTRVRTVTVGERPHLEVVLPDNVEKTVPVSVKYAVKDVLATPKARAQGRKSLPENSQLLDHAFVNTQPAAIGSYRVVVQLPDGARIHAVREQSPKTRRTEIEPRVSLNGADGRQGALLQLSEMKQGDRVSMSLEVVPDHRSIGWLLVGLVLAIGYLFGFRDLVFKPAAARLPAAQEPQFETKERQS